MFKLFGLRSCQHLLLTRREVLLHRCQRWKGTRRRRSLQLGLHLGQRVLVLLLELLRRFDRRCVRLQPRRHVAQQFQRAVVCLCHCRFFHLRARKPHLLVLRRQLLRAALRQGIDPRTQRSVGLLVLGLLPL